MIDLQDLGLDFIEDQGEQLRLGAMCTAYTLTRSDACANLASGILRDVGIAMGPQPVRNRVTVGGNVMQVFRWCDLPVALMAFDAEFELTGPGGTTRKIGALEFFDGQPRRKLGVGELLTSVIIPKGGDARVGVFDKLAQTAVDHALVNVALTLEMDGELCSSLRVVLGAVRNLPQRLESVEGACIGKRLDAEKINAAALMARQCDVKADRRGDEEYRRDVAVVMVRRALESATQRARETSSGGAAC